jgi:hypothetical protein
MPKIIVPVNNTDLTVSRLVAKSVTEQLLFTTEIPVIEDIIYVQRGGLATQAQMNNHNEPLKLNVDEYLTVEYKETFEADHFDVNKYQNEYHPVFTAKAIGVNVVPVYNRVQLEITYTYTSKSFNILNNWLNAFRRKLVTADAIGYHDVLYNYSIPVDVLSYLNKVYKLMKNDLTYTDTMKVFITKHFCKNGLILRQNLNDSNRQLAFNVKNTGCLGIFTQLPESVETSNDPPHSSVSFSYTLTYDRITAVCLEYQLYIFNQLIDISNLLKYCDKKLYAELHTGNRTGSQIVNTLTENHFKNDKLVYSIDSWRPSITPRYLIPSLVIPLQLDVSNLTNVLDLQLLTEFNYPVKLLLLMKQYKELLNKLYSWFIYLELFEVNDKTSLIPFYIDDNFNLISKVALNTRSRYYFRLSILKNLFKVDFTSLLGKPDDLLYLLQYLNSKVTLSTIPNSNIVTRSSLLAAINLIADTNLTALKTQRIQTSTFGVGSNKAN